MKRRNYSRIVYLVFCGTVLGFINGWFGPSERIRDPGSSESYTEFERAIHFSILGVIIVVSGWGSVVQLLDDYRKLKKKFKGKKTKPSK